MDLHDSRVRHARRTGSRTILAKYFIIQLVAVWFVSKSAQDNFFIVPTSCQRPGLRKWQILPVTVAVGRVKIGGHGKLLSAS